MMDNKKERLKVFLKISWVFSILSFIVLFAALMVYLYVDEATYNLIMFVLIIAVAIIILFAALIIYIVITAYQKGRINKVLAWIISKFIKLVMSVAIDLVSLAKIDKNIARGFFVDLNNIIVNSFAQKFTHDKILILVPHCLQWSKCPYKVTNDPMNCKRCGKCDIDTIVEISQKYKIKLSIASGGTMARKAIIENKPEVIISVACSRDLISGILDIEKIPVIAIENTTPEGPCLNTKVDSEKIEATIKKILIR